MVVVDTSVLDDFTNNPPDPSTFHDAGPYNVLRGWTAFHITAAWNRASEVPSPLVVDNRSMTMVNGETYFNARLQPNREYAIFYRVEVMSDTNEVSFFNSSSCVLMSCSHRVYEYFPKLKSDRLRT